MNIKKFINNKGITLIEIIVSISILVMISSIDFVKVSEVQKSARKKSDIVVSSNLVNATNLYLLDNPNKDKVSLTDLKNNGYISTIPKPQSKGENFSIEVSGDDINILIDGEKFYPNENN